MRWSILLFGVTGCVSQVQVADPSTGAGSLALTPGGTEAWVASADEGTVSLVDLATGTADVVQVGVEPFRIARHANHAFVTLRGEGAVAELRDEDGRATLVRSVPTGAEPSGIVADAFAERVFVALSAEGAVAELDGDHLAEQQRWPVDGQPTWLALHPSGAALYVGSAFGEAPHWIELGAATPVVHALTLPEFLTDQLGTPYAVRVTGDLAVSPGGDRVVFPVLYEDDQTTSDTSGYDGTEIPDGSRMRPALWIVPVDAQGVPDPSAATMLRMLTTDPLTGSAPVRSYVASVAFSDDGATLYAVMEGSSTLLGVDTRGLPAGEVALEGADAWSPLCDGLPTTRGFAVATDAGPRGIAVAANGDVYVHAAVDRALDRVSDASATADVLPAGGVATLVGEVTPRVLSEVAEAGRALFYSADNVGMAAAGSGISCATCHFQGRTDGLTWPLGVGQRQTPSLAGRLADTAPYTWEGDVASVADEAIATVTDRMGGEGVSATDAAAIEAYLVGLRAPDVWTAAADPMLVSRGAAIFASVGCVTCHVGASSSDETTHDVFGEDRVNTPSLRGISLTAPYLRSGSVTTLGEIITRAAAGEMGAPFTLTAADASALEAYLRTL